MASAKDARGLQLIDPVLTGLALNYRTDGLVYDQIVASQDVQTNAGQYPVWSADDFRRDDVSNEVADRAETPEIDVGYSLQPYALKNYRLKISISPEERAQAHDALRLEQTKLNFLLDRMALRRERRLAAALRGADKGGSFTQNALTVSTKWDAAAGATIEKDIKTARKTVYNATGQHVDTMVITWEVAYAMALDASVREILKYTVPGQMIIQNGEAILPKQIHGLNVVIVGNDMVNTAAEGATASLSSIWADNVRLIKRGVDNAWGSPATVYALRGQVLDTNQGRFSRGRAGYALVDRWAEADPPVDFVRAWEKVQEKVVAPDLGIEIFDVLT
jgi:hypothetical protein